MLRYIKLQGHRGAEAQRDQPAGLKGNVTSDRLASFFSNHLALLCRLLIPAEKTAALLLIALLLGSCGQRNKKQEYSRHRNGYYYKLISFSSDSLSYHPGSMNHLSAAFYTQGDSLFWDSYNNLGDNFYTLVDSMASDLLTQYSSRCSPGDSVCLLIRTADFFKQQFKVGVPFFSSSDSVVKLHFKVKKLLSPQELQSVHNNLQKKEQEQIRQFYKSETEYEQARDPQGFYWVEKGSAGTGPLPKPGDAVVLQYKGSYLNGRFLEASPEKFEMVYGSPDQLLPGLNYVIGGIKVGQNVKIILPSRLAFGENGSTNGIIPPYTPLLYELNISEIKR